MANIWSSHQRCESCGWAGTTKAHRRVVICILSYVLGALVLFALDGLGVLNIRRVVASWPVVVIALLWFYGLPVLLWRSNACGGCGKRMKPNLLSGRAPK